MLNVATTFINNFLRINSHIKWTEKLIKRMYDDIVLRHSLQISSSVFECGYKHTEPLKVTIPAEIGLLKQLTSISFVNVDLPGFPDEIWDLPHVRSVHMDHVHASFPAELARLPAFEHLSFTNQWVLLPSELTQLNRLQSLSIGKTQDRSLPP